MRKYKRKKREYIITNQLIRSGTSVGANIREACYAQTTADFITKMQIAIKECSESEYWIELLGKSGLTTEKNLQNHCSELMRLLTASLKTVKEHQSNK